VQKNDGRGGAGDGAEGELRFVVFEFRIKGEMGGWMIAE
jgi:hypothetical protein